MIKKQTLPSTKCTNVHNLVKSDYVKTFSSKIMAVQFTSKQFLKEMKKIKKKSLAMDNSNKNPMKAKYDIKFKKIFW